jgi:predicted nucleic acid-binding protein
MDPVFVDTNVFIRFLTQDEPDKAARAKSFLDRVESGELTIVISESIVVEIVQVLSSRNLYNLPRSRVAADVTTILNLPKLKVASKRVCIRALELWANVNVDFVDALTVAQMERQKIPTIASYDEDFDRFPQIQRESPRPTQSDPASEASPSA